MTFLDLHWTKCKIFPVTEIKPNVWRIGSCRGVAEIFITELVVTLAVFGLLQTVQPSCLRPRLAALRAGRAEGLGGLSGSKRRGGLSNLRVKRRNKMAAAAVHFCFLLWRKTVRHFLLQQCRSQVERNLPDSQQGVSDPPDQWDMTSRCQLINKR